MFLAKQIQILPLIIHNPWNSVVFDFFLQIIKPVFCWQPSHFPTWGQVFPSLLDLLFPRNSFHNQRCPLVLQLFPVLPQVVAHVRFPCKGGLILQKEPPSLWGAPTSLTPHNDDFKTQSAAITHARATDQAHRIIYCLSAFNFVLVLHPIRVPVMLPAFWCLLFIVFTVEKWKYV